jgi:hypothetical protein
MVDAPRGTTRTGRRGRRAGPLVAVLILLLLAGCTASPSRPRPDPDDEESLVVRTVSGEGRMSAASRAAAESEVGELLSRYLSAAFLGDHPRRDYVRALDVFTDGAAALAARDLDVLTAAGIEDAEKVTATDLDADLSWLVVDHAPVAASARVRFMFDARAGGDDEEVGLDGRLLLVRRDEGWSVFGYDVAGTTGRRAGTASTESTEGTP